MNCWNKILGGPGQTRKIHVEESWPEVQSGPRRKKRGHDRRIREVLQEDSRSSMYKVYDYIIVLERADMSCSQ
jgi:hypothetical protein